MEQEAELVSDSLRKKFHKLVNDMDLNKSKIILYQAEDGATSVAVRLENETVWLSRKEMADLFDRDYKNVSKHINNVFNEGELAKESVVANFATTGADGKTYQVEYFNLDVIISIGYRVKSQRGTQFRIWATRVLKEHLVKGFTVNQQRLAEKGVQEAQQVLNLLANTLTSHELVNDEALSVLNIVNRYAVTWRLLLQYDEDRLPMPDKKSPESVFLETSRVRDAIGSLKNELLQKGEATELFGNERNQGLEGVIGSIYQTFERLHSQPASCGSSIGL